MRLLIADDNQTVRRTLVAFVSRQEQCEVCGEAADSEQAIQKARELLPDLILLDVSMPGANGLDTARALRKEFPDVKILMLSQHDAAQLLPSSLEAGAQGCVDKARVATDLLPAIRNIFPL